MIAVLAACLAGQTAAQADDRDWAAHNRFLAASVGALRQDYRENDPTGLTADGTLNTERGSLDAVGLAARWQAQSLPLLLQASIGRGNGSTNYRGYLQAGNALTPYNGTTGNVTLDYAVRAGLAVPRGDRWQWMPFIELTRHEWRRDLTQYREDYGHTAVLAGLLMQWRQQGGSGVADGPWSVELEGAVGRMTAADIAVPKFGFAGPLGKRGQWQIAAAIGYDVASQWRVSACIAARRFHYGQSANQAGFFEPSSRTRQTEFDIGLGWRY